VAYVRAALAARGGAAVPDNFEPTEPGPSGRGAPGRMPQAARRSPQTQAFLEMLGLPYNLDPAAVQLRSDAEPPGHGRAPGLDQPAGRDFAGAVPGPPFPAINECIGAPLPVAGSVWSIAKIHMKAEPTARTANARA